jgi:hypothetical protein
MLLGLPDNGKGAPQKNNAQHPPHIGYPESGTLLRLILLDAEAPFNVSSIRCQKQGLAFSRVQGCAITEGP